MLLSPAEVYRGHGGNTTMVPGTSQVFYFCYLYLYLIILNYHSSNSPCFSFFFFFVIKGNGGKHTPLGSLTGTQAYLHTPSNAFLAVGNLDGYPSPTLLSFSPLPSLFSPHSLPDSDSHSHSFTLSRFL